LDLELIINSMLTCTVVITPGAGFLELWTALIAGPISVLIFTFFHFLLLHVCGIDDPLDVFAVHACGGIVGMLAVGLLHPEFGWCYSGDARFFGIEVLGTVVIGLFGFVMSALSFKLLDLCFGICYSEDEQLAGLDFFHFEVESQADLDWVSVQEFNVRERYMREQSCRRQQQLANLQQRQSLIQRGEAAHHSPASETAVGSETTVTEPEAAALSPLESV
jgi:hypothetical protein